MDDEQAPSGRELSPDRITCAALLADGAPCGAAALVHHVRYEYAIMALQPRKPLDYKILATHYDIQCPNCGTRRQSVKHE
jgi:hypothetical protein